MSICRNLHRLWNRNLKMVLLFFLNVCDDNQYHLYLHSRICSFNFNSHHGDWLFLYVILRKIPIQTLFRECYEHRWTYFQFGEWDSTKKIPNYFKDIRFWVCFLCLPSCKLFFDLSCFDIQYNMLTEIEYVLCYMNLFESTYFLRISKIVKH